MKRREFLKNGLALGSAALTPFVFSGGVPGNPVSGNTVPGNPAPHPTVCLADHLARFRWKNTVLTGYCADPSQKHPYFLPLVGPATGLPLTHEPADEPADEISQSWPHYRSMLLACDRVNGGNFRQGTLECGQIVSQGMSLGEQTKSSGELTDTCLWRRTNQEPVLEDKRRFRFTVLSDDRYMVDCSFELTPLVDLMIQATNHSLFSIRVAGDLSVSGGGTLVNSNGETNMTGTFGKPAKWCAFYRSRSRYGRQPSASRSRPAMQGYSVPLPEFSTGWHGKQSDHVEGIAILCPPKPFENCPWFTRDYGFMSPTPFHFLREPWQRQQGHSLTLRYRVVVWSGPLEQAGLDRLWDEFVI
ncbi:MAG: PmoA family protein [Planctomycetaceae bacterium]|nr:PmoA family protein [Planctomycetaceae bacterium]